MLKGVNIQYYLDTYSIFYIQKIDLKTNIVILGMSSNKEVDFYYIYTYKICVVTVVLYTKKLTYLKVFKM